MESFHPTITQSREKETAKISFGGIILSLLLFFCVCPNIAYCGGKEEGDLIFKKLEGVEKKKKKGKLVVCFDGLIGAIVLFVDPGVGYQAVLFSWFSVWI